MFTQEISEVKVKKGFSLLIVIFILLLFSLLASGIATIFATRSRISYGFYRSSQAFYICDIGMERAKQLLADDPNWRPPDNPGYFEESISIGSITGYYRIYIDEVDDTLQLRIESRVVAP